MSKWPINMKIKPTSLGNPENTSQNHSDVPLHAPYSGKILKGWKQYKMVADLISSHGHLIYSHIWNNFLLKGPLKAARQLLPIRKKKKEKFHMEAEKKARTQSHHKALPTPKFAATKWSGGSSHTWNFLQRSIEFVSFFGHLRLLGLAPER